MSKIKYGNTDLNPTILINPIDDSTPKGNASYSSEKINSIYNVRTYYNPSQLGLDYTATLEELYSALKIGNIFIGNASQFTDASWNLPKSSDGKHYYLVKICKVSDARATIELFNKYKNSEIADYIMRINADSKPDGIWYCKPIIDDNNKTNVSTYSSNKIESVVENVNKTNFVDAKGIELFGYVAPKLSNTVYDYIENGVYHKNVARIDLGELDWQILGSENKYFRSTTLVDNITLYEDDKIGDAYCDDYTTVNWNSLNGGTNMCLALGDTKRVYIRDSKYNDIYTFKKAMHHKYMYYKLVTEETKSIYSENITDKIVGDLDELKILGWNVPKEFSIRNYVDGNGIFHQRVERVNLGGLTWKYYSSGNYFYTNDLKSTIYTPSDKNVDTNIISNVYQMVKVTEFDSNMTMCLDTNNMIEVKNESYTDASLFKNAMNEVYLYYELSEEKTFNVDGGEIFLDIDDLKMIGYTIPKEFKIRNYTDLSGVYHQRVGRVDLGSLSWEAIATNTSGVMRIKSMGIRSLAKTAETTKTVANIYCSKYASLSNDYTYMKYDGIAITPNDADITLYDSEYNDSSANVNIKSKLNGIYLYYELNEEVTKSVDGNEIAIDTYSTTEVKTNKVWINGKPIYRKVIQYDTVKSITGSSTTLGTVSENIKLVNARCLYVNQIINYVKVANSRGNLTVNLPFSATQSIDTLIIEYYYED